MMMRMLEAGGLPALTDGVRRPDADNPNGYYEFEPVKTLENDASWIVDAQGKAVKIVYLLLRHLPATAQYDVIFMRRRVEEVIASQDEMLRHGGMSASGAGADRLAAYFDQQLRAIEKWLPQQGNFRVLYTDYNRTVDDAENTCRLVKDFLGLDLDTERMRSVVTRSLYRQRQMSAIN
jgi:hypothetical protein